MDFNKYYTLYLPKALPKEQADKMLKEFADDVTKGDYQIRKATDYDYNTFTKREDCDLFFILYNKPDVLQPQ